MDMEIKPILPCYELLSDEAIHVYFPVYNDCPVSQSTSYNSIDLNQIRADLNDKCAFKCDCSRRLLRNDQGTYIVRHWREKVLSKSRGKSRTDFLVSLYRQSRQSSNNKKEHNFEGELVCKMTWLRIMGISDRTYRRIEGYVRDDINPADSIVTRSNSTTVRAEIAMSFIRGFIERYGETGPVTDKYLMPPSVNIGYIFEEYTLAIKEDRLSIKRFYALFNKHFKKAVSFASYKYINPCDTCMAAKEAIGKAHDQRHKSSLKVQLQQHLDRQSRERSSYYDRRNEAVTKPSEVASVIIDGMDQSKTNLPHFRGWQSPKASTGMPLKTHVNGMILHGNRVYFLVDFLQYPHDSNMMLSCLLKSFSDCKLGNRALPPTLYIQCDNCGRENKNKYVLGFCAYLVLRGFVQEIVLSFLMKGHTHEDIDQSFSKISHHLQRVDAKTLPALLHALQKCMKHSPQVQLMQDVWDIKSWISPCLNTIQDHSRPHQFRFTMDRPGHCAFQWKLWSTDDSWTPSLQNPDQLEILKPDAKGDHMCPEGQPLRVAPDLWNKQNHDLIQLNIEKLRNHLAFEEYSWWQDFLKSPYQHEGSITTDWPLNSLVPGYLLTEERFQPEAVIDEIEMETEISHYLDKETAIPKVLTGKRTKKCLPTNQEAASVPFEVGQFIVFTSELGTAVGEIDSLQGDVINIILYEGKPSTAWQPKMTTGGCIIKVATERKYVLKKFKLTSSKHLPLTVAGMLE